MSVGYHAFSYGGGGRGMQYLSSEAGNNQDEPSVLAQVMMYMRIPSGYAYIREYLCIIISESVLVMYLGMAHAAKTINTNIA